MSKFTNIKNFTEKIPSNFCNPCSASSGGKIWLCLYNIFLFLRFLAHFDVNWRHNAIFVVLHCTKKVHIQRVGIHGGRDTQPSTGARRRMVLGHLNLLVYQIYPPVLLFLFMLLLLLCFLLPSSFPTLYLSIKS